MGKGAASEKTDRTMLTRDAEMFIQKYMNVKSISDITMKVIGIIGNDWYHVWFPATGEYGFVRQSDLTAGNG